MFWMSKSMICSLNLLACRGGLHLQSWRLAFNQRAVPLFMERPHFLKCRHTDIRMPIFTLPFKCHLFTLIKFSKQMDLFRNHIYSQRKWVSFFASHLKRTFYILWDRVVNVTRTLPWSWSTVDLQWQQIMTKDLCHPVHCSEDPPLNWRRRRMLKKCFLYVPVSLF